MNSSTFLFLSQIRIFWRLRRLIVDLVFWVRTRIFKIKHRVKEEKVDSGILLYLFRITSSQIFLAIIVAALLWVADPYFYEIYKKLNLTIPDDSDYVTFLATISGIGGVFIGLYYTSISAVSSSIYARVPNNIRDLLTHDRFGNMYMRFLSFLTFLGLVLIALRVISGTQIYLVIPTMTILSGVGIMSFVKLGQRAFYLFDPTNFSNHLFVLLQRCLDSVKVGGLYWTDSNFQHHSYKQAHSYLDTLSTLSDITSKETHLRSKPFLEICKRLFRFLIAYEVSKKYIPYSSRWYEQRHTYHNWYKTPDSHVSIAQKTGTALQPNIINNKEWVEDKVMPILKNYLHINLQEERYTDVFEFLELFKNYLLTLIKNGKTDCALDILENFGEVVLDIILTKPQEGQITNEIFEKIAIIDQFSVMPLDISLACREYVEKLDPDAVEGKLSNITWKKERETYIREFPAYCLSRLEWLAKRLGFEMSTEGHIVSPVWYQRELLLQVEVDVFTKNISALIEKGSKLYESWITHTVNTNHPWLTGTVMSREWEFWHKTDPQIDLWKAKWNNLSKGRKIKGLPWEDFNGNDLKEASKTRQERLLELMSRQGLILALAKRPEGFPDYAGQFLHTTGEVCFDALLENDFKFLSKNFELYFLGCMKQFEKLKPELTSTDWSIQQDFKIAVAPLLDVIDISGYARLMADYHDNEQLWRTVVTTWDRYLEPQNAELLPLFAGAISLIFATFEIPHRSRFRTQWKMNIIERLSDVPRCERFSQNSIYPDIVADHNSTLIRVFAREQYGPDDGIDIFTIFYLRAKEGAEELDFGRKGKSLQNSLDREERNKSFDSNSENPK